MKFLVDAQLPPALTKLLFDSGHVAEHVFTVGLRDAEDEPIWEYAVTNQSVIISKDEDFAARRALRNEGPPIVWIRIGNCSNRALMQWFLPLLPEVLQRLQAGETLIEII